ncbi:MAG: hypothetical protein JWN37_581 [Candidatus Nomurabacteria bacterium]|nr:hypothetical protein [Candidatus Nomurabacteria bacterium]
MDFGRVLFIKMLFIVAALMMGFGYIMCTIVVASEAPALLYASAQFLATGITVVELTAAVLLLGCARHVTLGGGVVMFIVAALGGLMFFPIWRQVLAADVPADHIPTVVYFVLPFVLVVMWYVIAAAQHARRGDGAILKS